MKQIKLSMSMCRSHYGAAVQGDRTFWGCVAYRPFAPSHAITWTGQERSFSCLITQSLIRSKFERVAVPGGCAGDGASHSAEHRGQVDAALEVPLELVEVALHVQANALLQMDRVACHHSSPSTRATSRLSSICGSLSTWLCNQVLVSS